MRGETKPKPAVVLVNAPDMSDKSEKHFSKPDHPRISIAYLAAYLKKSDIPYGIIDGKYENINSSSLVQRIVDLNPPLVGFTAMTPELVDVVELARQVKEAVPEIKSVIGGPHATALPEETLREFPVFDYAISGEGEITLAELVNSYKDTASLKNIPGLAFRENGNIRFNPGSKFVNNIEDIPVPDWESFSGADAYPILTARGCPFQCNFCMQVSGRKLRKRSPENVIDEIEHIIENFHPDKLTFHDETFGIDKVWTHKLLDMMLEKNIHKKIRWEATTRVDIADLELYKKIKATNCSFLGYGVESGNAKILKQTKKNITLEQVENAVKLANKAKLSTGSMFIIGHPNETRSDIEDTINFASKLKTDTTACGIMVPYPGTEIAEIVKRGEGNYKVISTDWSDFNKQIGNILELNDIPRKDLEYFQLKLYLKFYLLHFRPRKFKSLVNFMGFTNMFSGVALIIRNFLKRKRK